MRRPLESLAPNLDHSDTAEHRKRRRREHLRRFVEEEADCDSDEDMDGDVAEEEVLAAIEAEEAAAGRGFINDSSQLGYTQDALDRCDPDARRGETLHRALDAERAQREAFATPLLNRRFLLRRRLGQALSQDDDNGPGSEKALGRMHFIRSVLEHQRRGGAAEDIERLYRDMAGAATQAAYDDEEDSDEEDGDVAVEKVVGM